MKKKLLFRSLALIMLGISMMISIVKLGFGDYAPELILQVLAWAFLMLDILNEYKS